MPPLKLAAHEVDVADRIIHSLAECVRSHDDSPLGIALVLNRLSALEHKLDAILANQEQEKKSMSTVQETVNRLITDFNTEKGEIAALLTTTQGAVTLISGIPATVAAAVADAIAKNPAADLSGLDQLATDMEANDASIKEAQAALQAAIDAASAPTAPPVVAEPAPAPETPADAPKA